MSETKERKRPSYRGSVEFIALNDDPSCTDLDDVRGSLTVGLLADQYGKETEDVAKDVIAFREKHG